MKFYFLNRIINGKSNYLRYGLNGGQQVGFCVNRGEIVAFKTREEAETVRESFDFLDEWDIECFVSK